MRPRHFVAACPPRVVGGSGGTRHSRGGISTVCTATTNFGKRREVCTICFVVADLAAFTSSSDFLRAGCSCQLSRLFVTALWVRWNGTTRVCVASATRDAVFVLVFDTFAHGLGERVGGKFELPTHRHLNTHHHAPRQRKLTVGVINDVF